MPSASSLSHSARYLSSSSALSSSRTQNRSLSSTQMQNRTQTRSISPSKTQRGLSSTAEVTAKLASTVSLASPSSFSALPFADYSALFNDPHTSTLFTRQAAIYRQILRLRPDGLYLRDLAGTMAFIRLGLERAQLQLSNEADNSHQMKLFLEPIGKLLTLVSKHFRTVIDYEETEYRKEIVEFWSMIGELMNGKVAAYRPKMDNENDQDNDQEQEEKTNENEDENVSDELEIEYLSFSDSTYLTHIRLPLFHSLLQYLKTPFAASRLRTFYLGTMQSSSLLESLLQTLSDPIFVVSTPYQSSILALFDYLTSAKMPEFMSFFLESASSNTAAATTTSTLSSSSTITSVSNPHSHSFFSRILDYCSSQPNYKLHDVKTAVQILWNLLDSHAKSTMTMSQRVNSNTTTVTASLHLDFAVSERFLRVFTIFLSQTLESQYSEAEKAARNNLLAILIQFIETRDVHELAELGAAFLSTELFPILLTASYGAVGAAVGAFAEVSPSNSATDYQFKLLAWSFIEKFARATAKKPGSNGPVGSMAELATLLHSAPLIPTVFSLLDELIKQTSSSNPVRSVNSASKWTFSQLLELCIAAFRLLTALIESDERSRDQFNRLNGLERIGRALRSLIGRDDYAASDSGSVSDRILPVAISGPSNYRDFFEPQIKQLTLALLRTGIAGSNPGVDRWGNPIPAQFSSAAVLESLPNNIAEILFTALHQLFTDVTEQITIRSLSLTFLANLTQCHANSRRQFRQRNGLSQLFHVLSDVKLLKFAGIELFVPAVDTLWTLYAVDSINRQFIQRLNGVDSLLNALLIVPRVLRKPIISFLADILRVEPASLIYFISWRSPLNATLPALFADPDPPAAQPQQLGTPLVSGIPAFNALELILTCWWGMDAEEQENARAAASPSSDSALDSSSDELAAVRAPLSAEDRNLAEQCRRPIFSLIRAFQYSSGSSFALETCGFEPSPSALQQVTLQEIDSFEYYSTAREWESLKREFESRAASETNPEIIRFTPEDAQRLQDRINEFQLQQSRLREFAELQVKTAEAEQRSEWEQFVHSLRHYKTAFDLQERTAARLKEEKTINFQKRRVAKEKKMAMLRQSQRTQSYNFDANGDDEAAAAAVAGMAAAVDSQSLGGGSGSGLNTQRTGDSLGEFLDSDSEEVEFEASMMRKLKASAANIYENSIAKGERMEAEKAALHETIRRQLEEQEADGGAAAMGNNGQQSEEKEPITARTKYINSEVLAPDNEMAERLIASAAKKQSKK